MRLQQFFNKASKWCQGHYALNKQGKSIGLTSHYPTDEMDYLREIESMSLYGAIALFYAQYSDGRDQIVRRLKIAINRHTGKNLTIAAFNDDSQTTFEDIQKVIKFAVALR
jgi:hypothetical protein